MTERRRNFFVLLLVFGLIIGSAVVVASQPTKLGLDLKGGVSLVFEGKPTKQSKVTGAALDRSIDIIRKRVDKLGVAEPEIQRVGSAEIDVSLPGVKNLNDAVTQVGTTAQLHFYDWEPSVLGADDKPHPTDANVTGGPSAGSAQSGACFKQYDAIIRASRRKPANQKVATTTGLYYLVDDKTRHVLQRGVPQETQKDLLADLPGRKVPPGDRVKYVPPGTIVVEAEGTDTGTAAQKNPDCYFVLNDVPALSGTDIKDPAQGFDDGPGGTGAPNVTFNFSDKGKKIWQKVTRAIAQRGQDNFIPGSDPQNAFQHFAIVLDNQIISTPYIDFQQNPDGIDATNGSEISGGFTIGTAQNLANLLATGALPIKLKLISSSQVSATLGKQALDQGVIAGIVGFAIVAFFLLLFYRVLGVIAVGALLVYALYFYALIKLIPITLTLPGIAGLILGIGVAADANIVIFERVKEEIRLGRSVVAGIATGYKKGIAAIIDANVVTFMTAFILFILATAGVRGFAFTLGVGTLVSLFTAVLLTQAVLGTMGRSRLISHPAALGAGKLREHTRFDFMGKSKWFFSFSGCILLIGALAIGGKGIHFGIDFESGTRITESFVQKTDENHIRDAVSALGIKNPEVQRIIDKKNANTFQVSTSSLAPDQVRRVTDTLDSRFTLKQGTQNIESIGPTFGNTVAQSAIVAIIASLLVISVYIALRFEWKYAVPVLIALMHDLLITAGVYSLTGREVTTSTVAALLTILGYSLYDTVIVFDRVRENVPRMPRAAFSQIVNRSMSEVLTRSLATSFCTCLPIAALLIFGGATLKDFAFALLIGVLSGAYSSVFIASPVLTHWKEREPVYSARHARIAALNNGIVPAYATAGPGGEPVDVAPAEERRPNRRVTTPDDPALGVSPGEFQAMVADLGLEGGPAGKPKNDPAADLTPDELVLKDQPKRTPKPKRPRNSKHGRKR